MSKGITIWEQHVEKFVLGLVGLVLLGALFLLVTESPNSAKVGSETLTPGEVNQRILAKASELDMRLQSNSESEVAAFGAVEAASADGFIARLDASVSPIGELEPIAPMLAGSLLPDEVGESDNPYYQPRIAAQEFWGPVMQQIDTVSREQVNGIEGLASYFDSGSYDIVWTTPVIEIDLGGIRAELQGQDLMATPPQQRIPEKWTSDRPAILDVMFERQTRLADGSWSDPVEVAAVPGLRSIREEIREINEDYEEGLTAKDRNDFMKDLADPLVQQEVLQPDFYQTMNAGFSPPSLGSSMELDEDTGMVDVVDPEEMRRRDQSREIQRRLRDRTSTLRRIEATLDELGGEMEEEDQTEDRGRGGRGDRGRGGSPPGGGDGGFGGPGGGMGGGGQGKKSGSSSQNEANKRRRIGLTKKANRLRDEISRLEVQLAELDPSAASMIEKIESSQVAKLVDVQSDGMALAWTHDLDVEQGMTYRYRATVRILNPFFSKSRQLLDSQKSLDGDIYLSSAPSEWSDPITIDPPVQFFFTSATRGPASKLGEAKVELYRYQDGKRRKDRVTITPGQLIGYNPRGSGEFDFTTNWYLVDVVQDPAVDASSTKTGNSIVICRSLDGDEIRVEAPARMGENPEHSRLDFDATNNAEDGA